MDILQLISLARSNYYKSKPLLMHHLEVTASGFVPETDWLPRPPCLNRRRLLRAPLVRPAIRLLQ